MKVSTDMVQEYITHHYGMVKFYRIADGFIADCGSHFITSSDAQAEAQKQLDAWRKNHANRPVWVH